MQFVHYKVAQLCCSSTSHFFSTL